MSPTIPQRNNQLTKEKFKCPTNFWGGKLNFFIDIFYVHYCSQLSTAIGSAQPNLVKNPDQDLSILQWAATLLPKELLDLDFE